MINTIRKIFSFVVLLTLFVCSNHCIFEEIFSDSTISHCAPVENNEHSHGTPCGEFVTIVSDSQDELVSNTVVFEIANYFKPIFADVAFSNKFTILNLLTFQAIKQELPANFLILSPNAPPFLF